MSVTLFANAASRIHLRSRWFIGNASLYSSCLPGIRSRLFPFPRFYDLPFLGISENCRSVFQRLVLSGTPYFSCCIKSWRKRCWSFSSGAPFGGPSVPWGRLLGYPAHRFVDPTCRELSPPRLVVDRDFSDFTCLPCVRRRANSRRSFPAVLCPAASAHSNWRSTAWYMLLDRQS